MSRKPIDQSVREPKPQGQDGVWVEIRRMKTFTALDIVKATDITKKTVTDYIKRLVAGGYLKQTVPAEPHGVHVFTLLRDAGVHAPRVRMDGTPVTQGGVNANMWRSMRIIKAFTPRELVAYSNTDTVKVSEQTAKTYCSMLLKAGYLRVMQKAVPGKRQATYRFIRDTGPKPPKIQRVKQVFDPNLNEVTYRQEGRI